MSLVKKMGMNLGLLTVVACGPFIDLGNTSDGKPLDQAQEVAVEQASHLNLANSFGNITVIGEAGRTEVSMTPTLHSDDPGAGHIVVANDGEEVSVAIFAQDLAGDAIQVDIEVRTPENLTFKVATGGGSLSLSGMVGGGESATGDGNATLDLELADGAALSVATGAGDISLTLPAATMADVSGATGAGSVSVDSALDFDGVNVGGALEGTLNGGGGSSIQLSTASGAVSLLAR